MLHHLTWGDPAKPAIVMLHGCPGRAAHFTDLASRLAASHFIVAVGMPGYDGSPALPAPYDVAAATAAIEEVIASKGITRAAIVGHSLGCYRAPALTLGGRLEVTRLVLLGGLAGVDAEARQGFKQLAALVRSGADMGPVLAQVYFAPGYADAHPEHLAEVLGWTQAIAREDFAVELDGLGSLPDLRPRLGEIAVPITLRVGTADLSTPPAWSEVIAERAPQAKLELVEGVGHALLLEDREATTASVLRALG